VTPAVVDRAEVEPPHPLARAGGRPHLAVLVSLNFPDLTEPVARLVRRFTGSALAAVTAAGASYELLDSSDPAALEVAVDADGLFVLGGGDVANACYGGPTGPAPNSYGVDEAADRVSLDLIHAYIGAGRPVLGICRGSQLINVAYGGTLIPDIEDHYLHHGGPGEPMFLDEKIDVMDGTRLASLVGAGPLTVRSGHHQAVDRVGDGLVVAARALDGIVEATEDPHRWVLGVQFHPEDDDGSDRELGLLLDGLVAVTR